MVHEVDVIDGGTMTDQRKQIIVDWFAQQIQLPTDTEVAQWAKGVFGGEWIANKITQEGTFQRHWTHCTCVDTDFWIELGIDRQWYYLLFRISPGA